VGSTRLWAEHELVMAADLATHDELVTTAIAAAGGRRVARSADAAGCERGGGLGVATQGMSVCRDRWSCDRARPAETDGTRLRHQQGGQCR
jgi:hypothetical protein